LPHQRRLNDPNQTAGGLENLPRKKIPEIAKSMAGGINHYSEVNPSEAVNQISAEDKQPVTLNQSSEEKDHRNSGNSIREWNEGWEWKKEQKPS
jgi:hypothetical protein